MRWIGVAGGLSGAFGVALAAVGAHGTPDPAIDSAALILLVHAPTLLTLAGRTGRLIGATGVAMVGGLVLFAGDIALDAFTSADGLFPGAAPLGGTLLIGAWLAVAAAALTGRIPPD